MTSCNVRLTPAMTSQDGSHQHTILLLLFLSQISFDRTRRPVVMVTVTSRDCAEGARNAGKVGGWRFWWNGGSSFRDGPRVLLGVIGRRRLRRVGRMGCPRLTDVGNSPIVTYGAVGLIERLPSYQVVPCGRFQRGGGGKVARRWTENSLQSFSFILEILAWFHVFLSWKLSLSGILIRKKNWNFIKNSICGNAGNL